MTRFAPGTGYTSEGEDGMSTKASSTRVSDSCSTDGYVGTQGG